MTKRMKNIKSMQMVGGLITIAPGYVPEKSKGLIIQREPLTKQTWNITHRVSRIRAIPVDFKTIAEAEKGIRKLQRVYPHWEKLHSYILDDFKKSADLQRKLNACYKVLMNDMTVSLYP